MTADGTRRDSGIRRSGRTSLGSDPDIIGRRLPWMTFPMSWSASRRISSRGTSVFRKQNSLFRSNGIHFFLTGQQRVRSDRTMSGCTSTAACRPESALRRRARPFRPSHRSWLNSIRRRTSSRPASSRRTTPCGNLAAFRIPGSSGRRVHPDRNGASGRVPEHLRHDAGSQRDAGAGTVDTPGDRRQPGTAGAVSFSRSHLAGGSWRDSRLRSCSSTFRRCCRGWSGNPFRFSFRRR